MSKFDLSKFNNKHFLALAGNGILSMFGLGFIYLLYVSLSVADVGKWFYFFTVLGLCEAVRNGFLGTATVKFYAGKKGDEAVSILGSVWLLALLVTLIIGAINLAGLPFLHYVEDPSLRIVVKWLGLTFLSSLPFSVVFWILQAEEDYGRILKLRLVNSGSMILIFGVLVISKQMTIEKAFMYNFITNCLTSVVALLWGAKIFTLFKCRKDNILEIVHFGKYSLATTLSSSLLRSTDTFIIQNMLGSAALAIYGLPVRLMEIVEIPLRSFVGTGMSGMATAYNNNDMGQVARILKKYSGMLTVVFVPMTLLVLVFADIPISLLGHNKINGTAAANIYRLFMVFAIMYPIDRFNGITLDVIHKPQINFQKVLVMLAVNAAADYVGIMLLGNIYGVAFGAFLTTLAGIIFGYFHLRKYVDYTIGGILHEGYIETKLFMAKNIPFLRQRTL